MTAVSSGVRNTPRLRQSLSDAGVDILVGTSYESLEYLIEYHDPSQELQPQAIFAAFPQRDDLPCVLVVPRGLAASVVQRGTTADMIVTYGNFYLGRRTKSLTDEERHIDALVDTARGDAVSALIGVLAELGLNSGRLALDESGLLPVMSRRIRSALVGWEIADGYDLLESVRVVKTPEEVDRLRTAARISEYAISECMRRARPNLPECELERTFDDVVRAFGAVPTFAAIASGRRAAYPDNVPTADHITPNSVLRFDVGCTYRNYHSDVARTAVVGRSTERVRRYYEAVLRGQQQMIDMVRSGVPVNSLFEAGVAEVGRTINGYARHHTGHGIGIEPYDPPLVAPHTDSKLEPGTVLNLEMPYYELGWGGVMIEDTLVVTDESYHLLTSLSRELVEL